MFIKAIIFDLDDTLYDYKNADKISYAKVIKYLVQIKKCTTSEILPFLSEAKELVKKTLSSHTSSHNRILYFQKISELLNLSYEEVDKINDIYWQTFYNSITPRDGVIELFEYLKENRIKIAILTNFTTEHQYKKLIKLGLLKYIDTFVSSEEIGVEKPDKRAFLSVINKLGIPTSSLLMVGDDFESDIRGAIQNNIYAAYFSSSKILTANHDYLTFNKFEQLLKLIQDLTTAINQLYTLCNRYGQRFDLTQAGGGNISVKVSFGDKTLLIIKASGFALADVSKDTGYVILNNDNPTEKLLLKTILRPSIETAMHSLLQTYTVHLHAIQAIHLLVKKDAKNIINSLFPKSLFIEYFTPGEELANAVQKVYNSEKLIFLKNHGILLTSTYISDFDIILDEINKKIEQILSVQINQYKIVNLISDRLELIFKKKFVTYLIEDKIILNHLLDQKLLDQITTPDKLVYCGVKVLRDLESLESFKEPPSLVLYKDQLFSVAYSLKKCKEIVDVFKAHLLFSSKEDEELNKEEIKYLLGWDAEKYRKRL